MPRPPLFESLSFPEAIERAKALGRWLVVDATAEWCQPCKLMDRTSWVDSSVVTWVQEHAIALQVDVDAEGGLSEKLGIRAMPTVIAFKDGQEVDRVVGYRNPDGLLGWLHGLEKGESALDQMRRSLTEPEKDMQGRLAFARALLMAGRADEATEEYVWLWNNMTRIDPAMAGVRGSFMASEIASLVSENAAARERFAAIRDGAERDAGAGGAAAPHARFDWIVLNELVHDDERTMRWFETIKDDPGHAATLRLIAHRIIPVLQANGRWADIGRLHADPLAELNQHRAMMDVPEGVPREMRDQFQEMMARGFRENAGLLYASLRAAGRFDEAAAVEKEALRLDPGEEMKTALREALEAAMG